MTNLLAMGVREAPGDPPADDFKATCNLQPGARLKASLPFLGVWGGTGGLPCRVCAGGLAALVALAAFALVGDMGACWQMISKVYAAPGRWLKLEKAAQVQECNPYIEKSTNLVILGGSWLLRCTDS